MTSSPSLDTQATLLLCTWLGSRDEGSIKPLTTRQYSELARWLHDRSLRPGDLLKNSGRNQLNEFDRQGISSELIYRLLDRGTALAIMVERWTSRGIWIISRGDITYPKRCRAYLQHNAPPIIYGVGDLPSLSQGGLAVVGSREAREEDLEFARRVGAVCASQHVNLISGAARGIDSESMMSTVDSGGRAVGVLAEGLGRTSVASKYRDGIMDGRLTLVSPFDPESRWFSFNAMERNKLIYALADAALVVSCSDEKSGTWAGAMEALKHGRIPVYVKSSGSMAKGNKRLLQLGSREFPVDAWDNISELFLKPSKVAPLFEVQDASQRLTLPNRPDIDDDQTPPAETLPDPLEHKVASTDAYTVILNVLLEILREPREERSVAELLDVVPTQARAWIKRAVNEGRARKLTKPVRYLRVSDSLFSKP